MRKVVLADNDIIHKLACCGLLQELLQWLGVPPAEVWVLPSMRFMLRKKLKADAAALADLEQFLLQVSDLPAADINMLALFPLEMDVGERQMLAILVNTPEVEHMVTGDKRALRLIGGMCANDPALNQRLNQARVDCLESIMLAFIEQLGFEAVNAKVLGGLKSDTVLQADFGARSWKPTAGSH
ncbi:hypothetical protein [Rhodoferax sp.]|uniref:hypothetical protein n=1 Tax=Rhodoferax sp. TaxID=50421 RepID=UPI002ACD9915|nr:hypothetical protein [Rhodoferax sp.]MDZ7920057.1 hypothetical protein [Rhodoferax sp.]